MVGDAVGKAAVGATEGDVVGKAVVGATEGDDVGEEMGTSVGVEVNGFVGDKVSSSQSSTPVPFPFGALVLVFPFNDFELLFVLHFAFLVAFNFFEFAPFENVISVSAVNGVRSLMSFRLPS